jgi:hypothetical protein
MNFDLNIQNYNLSELEEIFELPKGYNNSMFEIKESRLRQNIQSNSTIHVALKPKILDFLSQAKKYIMENYNKNANSNEQSVETIKKTYANIYNLDNSLQPSEIISDGGTFIIKKPKTPYGQSKPSEFYEGTINPLDNRILRKNLNIDTRFRDNYYITQSSNFHFDLPIRFNQVVSMQLSAIEFPNTFYSISKMFGNNFFSIVIQNVRQVIIIPDGNYINATLETYLNGIMQLYSISNDPIINLFQYIQFKIDDVADSGNGQMIVSVRNSYPGPNELIFTLEFNHSIFGEEDKTPLPLKIGWLFGFRKEIYIEGNRYVSEGIVDLKGIRYLYLVVDDFNNNVNNGFYGAFNSSILNKNILARITLFGVLFSNVISQNNLALITSPRQYFGPVVIQKMQIQLLDEYGRIIDLNNMDYSFCLTLQTIYDL